MIIINKIKNYKKINKELLNLINKIDNPFKQLNDYISNTDWSLPKEYKRDYLNYFNKIISPYMFKIASKLHSKNWEIHNIWFQQYLKYSRHNWHVHEYCQFTNIYFVELPDKSLATEIFKHKKLNIKEGDLLTFPSYYYHRSPKNLLNKRKTIISFNSSFGTFNKK
jgi:hypothetical protein